MLGVTAALVSYAPPSEASRGPGLGHGGARPGARSSTRSTRRAAGRNQMHLYLFDAEDGAQYTDAKELTVDLELPEKDIGPIEAELQQAGPGHYVAPSAPFGVPGDWKVDVRDARVALRAGRDRPRGPDRMTVATFLVTLVPLARLRRLARLAGAIPASVPFLRALAAAAGALGA